MLTVPQGVYRVPRPARAGAAAQPAQVFAVAEQVQAAPQDAAGDGLAGMGGDRAALAGAVDGQHHVDRVRFAAHEPGAELPVQDRGDLDGQGPGQDTQSQHLGGLGLSAIRR